MNILLSMSWAKVEFNVSYRMAWMRTIGHNSCLGSVFKRDFERNHSYENVFPIQVHFHANQTHFYMKGFARRLALKSRYKRNAHK